MTVAGQNGRLTFSGSYSQKVSVSLSGDTIPGTTYVYLMKPDGSQQTYTYVGQNGTGFIDTQALTMAGTYTIMVDPQGANTGGMTVQLVDATDVNAGVLTAGGASITANTTAAGQNAKATFSGTAGQRVSLNITGVSIAGAYVYLKNPDGAQLAYVYTGTGGAFLDTQTLPATGTYTILVDPQGTNTGSATLQLYNVPADGVGTITAGGAAVTVAASSPGHNPQLTFSGSYGQRVSVSLSGDTIPGGTYVYLVRPDGSQQTYAYVGQNGTGLIDMQTLPMAGTYTIMVDPQGANTGSMTVQLNDVSDVSASISANGSPVTVTTTIAGQNAQLSFNGTQGQRVSLDISNVTIPGTYVYLRNPDGAQLAYVYTGTGGAFLDTQTLPVTGVYTIFVDPSNTSTGSATLKLFDVPADEAGPITPGGVPVTVTATAPGHNPKLTFTGVFGQKVSLSLSGDTIPGTTYVYLMKPDGSQQTYTYVGQNGTGFIDLQSLPMPGTYTVLVDPQGTNTGNLSVQLNDATDANAGAHERRSGTERQPQFQRRGRTSNHHPRR
jgi:hypothetical protein